MRKSPTRTALLLLSTLLLFHCFPLSSCVYRVYIRRCELASYFEGTQDFDTVKGHHVDIIRRGKVTVDSDGSLQLSTNLTEDGSGMMPMMTPLPPIPSDVSAVTISWHANEVVNYSLEIAAVPEGLFKMPNVNVSLSGTIPLEKSGFRLKFECHSSSVGEGQLIVNLTTVSIGENLTASFHLDKICEGMTGSGSNLPLEPSVLDITSSFIMDTTASPSLVPPPSLETTPLPAIQTTFLPSSIVFTPSPSPSSWPDAISPSSSLPLTTSAVVPSTTVNEDVYLMPFPTSMMPGFVSSSVPSFAEATSSPVFSPSPSSPSPVSPSRSSQLVEEITTSLISTPTPVFSSSSDLLLSSPGPTTGGPLATISTIFASTSLFSTTTVVEVSPTPSPSPQSPSAPLSTPSTSMASSSSPSAGALPTPSSPEGVVSPSFSSSPSSQPPAITGRPVNGTEVEEGLSRLTMLLIIVFAPVVGVLLFAICVAVCCICCCACKGKKKPRRVFSDDPLDLPVRYSREVNENELEESFSKNAGPPLTVWMPLLWGAVSTLPAAVQSIIKHYTVDRRSLSILSVVTRDDNGAVVKGQWNVDSVDPVGGNKGVMMKMLTGFEKQYGHRDEIVQFVEQATLLRGRDHPNIHKVLKVSVEDNYIPLVVYPIVEYGNMHQFLTFCRVSPNESPLNGRYRKLLTSATILPVTIQYKANFALQIASAMHFLSEEGIVHPDLALRNCLLDTGYTVKVSDGSLSQLFYPECYSYHRGTIRPVRWAAVETLKQGQCTSASNVWSYGVTVWEILTLGETPYSNIEVVSTSVMMGERLPQPPECPKTMYDMLRSCWEENPTMRPTFYALLAYIDDISSQFMPVSDSGNSTPAPIKMNISGSHSRQSTPGSRHEAVQHVTAVPIYPPQPQYVPVVASDDDDEVFGVPQDRKNSAASLASQRSKDSQQPEKLSITFSVLSGDLLGEGGESSSESEGEEGDEKEIDVLEPELLDRFMPSLRREPVTGSETAAGGMSTEALTSKPVLTLTSPSVGAMHNNLEDTSRYRQLSNTALSPGPFSTSTMTSRLSPSETSSQYGPSSTVRSDDTPVPPLSSPSPDLTSKTSTIGDETLSTASNPLLAGTYHNNMPSTGMLSKTSTLESVNTAVSASTADYSHPTNLVYTPHLNGSQYNGTEHRNNTSTSDSVPPPLSNGHPPGPKANGDVINKSSIQSPPLQNSMMSSSSLSDRTQQKPLDSTSKEPTVNGGVVLREGVGDRQTSRDSQLSRTSFGLGLGDLSSDLLSTFDSFMQ